VTEFAFGQLERCGRFFTDGAMRMRKILFVLSLSWICGCVNAATGVTSAVAARPPNVLLIVADDLGFADIGVYGSEIRTPNIDMLAKQGMQLTNFHVGQACSISRAMLLSGTDAHLAGVGNMAETMRATRDVRLGLPGYEGHLSLRVAALPERMRRAGYRTYMTGKWHLGADERTNPAARGFDRSFALMDGGASHMNGLPLVGPPREARYQMDGKPARVPDGFYSTQFYAEKLIEYLKPDPEESRPFFAYLAFTAPHWPLQAPAESVAAYHGAYDDGYEALQASRVRRMKALGLIPRTLAPAPLPMAAPQWSRLNAGQRASESRKMEIYAAMVSDMDRYIGKVIQYLKDTRQYDDTLIIFISDNGPEGSLFEATSWGALAQWVAACCNNTMENMGRGDSYLWLGPGWAWAAAAPFRGLKGGVFEGGLRVPAVIHYPAKVKGGARSDTFATIMDVMPTILDARGIAEAEQTSGPEALPMRGSSMWPLLTGMNDVVHPAGDVVGWELWGIASVRQANMKMIFSTEAGEPQRQLFDLAADPAEQHDLSGVRAGEVQRLESLWKDYARQVGLLPVGSVKPE
jgi:arylsulfatase